MSFRPPSGPYGRRGDEDRPPRRRDEDRSPYDAYRPSWEQDPRDRSRGATQPSPIDRQSHLSSRPDSPVHERRGQLPLRSPDTQASALRKEQHAGILTGPRIPNNVAVTPTGPRGSAGVAAVLEEWNVSQAAVNKLEQQRELKVAALGQKFSGRPSEQPSFPEYQNKIRRQLEKEIERLEDKLKTAKARHNSFNSELAVMLTEKMPLEIQNLVQQTISNNLKSYIADIEKKTAKQLEEKTAPLLTKIGDLELKVALLHEGMTSEGTTSQTQTTTADPRYDAQQKLIEKLMSRLQAVEDQQKNKAIAKPAPATVVDEAAIARRVETLAASQSMDKEFFVQLNKKLTEDLGSIRVEMASLDKRLSESEASLRAETVNVTSQVATLSAVVANDYNAAKAANEGVTTSFEHMTSKLSDTDKIVAEHKKKLARLDVEVLEKVADSYSFLDWDGVQTAVSSTLPGLQSRVDQLAESLPKVEKRVDQLHQQTTEIKQVSEAVPELQGRIKKFDETEEAMKQLAESVPSLQKRAGTYDQDVPDLQRRVDQLEHKAQEMKHLAESVPNLQDRVEKLDAKTEQKVLWDVVQQYMLAHPTNQEKLTTTHVPQPTSNQLLPAAGVTVVGKVSELERKVSSVDSMAQATVLRVKEHGKKLGVHEKKLEVHDAGFLKVGEKILEMIEDCKTVLRAEFSRDLKELDNRLESRVAAQNFPISAEDIESFRTKVEGTEATVAKLDSDVKDLAAKIGKIDYIDHQITALETRCDNISAAKIVDAVITRIRILWSDPAALAANIALVSQSLQAFQAKVDAQITKISQSIAGSQRQLQNPSQSQSPATQSTPLAGNKRRRTETFTPDGRGSATNGNHR